MEKRIKKVYQLLEEEELDGLLIDSDVNRFYLSGFTGTAGRLLFSRTKSYFLTDFRYTQQAQEQTSGFEVIEVNQGIEEKINELLAQEGIKKLGFEADIVSYEQYQKYQERIKAELVPCYKLIASLRVIKDKEEISRIKKAVEITDQAFEHILTFIKEGITEREVALELEYFMKKQGAEKNSFDFIVASGKRSALPHGVATDKKIEVGDLITIDFGTVYQGYCSDMTRTIALGKVSPEQEAIYNLVLKAQLKVIETIKPGMTMKEADAVARDLIAEAGYKDNFGHGLGHGIGIEIHEEPRLSFTADGVLKPGMVVTDEPGIYIPAWGGVRIEDDLLITEDGCEVLNSSPKELIIL